jgi:serine/threonine protein kinase
LIDADGYAKLTDFGLSKYTALSSTTSQTDDNNYSSNTICGTREYLAPEVLSGNYSTACDWWQFGCLIYEMLVGLPPFYNREDLFDAIMNDEPNYPD